MHNFFLTSQTFSLLLHLTNCSSSSYYELFRNYSVTIRKCIQLQEREPLGFITQKIKTERTTVQ